MPDASTTRSEQVARFLLAHAGRLDDGGDSFTIEFPPKHSSLVEARFTECTARELGRGEDLAMVQMLRHLLMRERAGQRPKSCEWLDDLV